jgi:hypothetical protein
MKPGAYENLINKTNNAEIENAESEGMESKKKRIDSAESSKFLAEYLSDILKKKIEGLIKMRKILILLMILVLIML